MTRGRPGQHPVAGEGGHVGGGADQHRATRVVGRSTPAVVTGGADQAVDQRGLARAGRAADDGEQRGVEVAQPRQQVVVDLVDDAPRGAAGGVPVGGGQAQRGGRAAGPAAPSRASGSRSGGAVTPRFCPGRRRPTRRTSAEVRRRVVGHAGPLLAQRLEDPAADLVLVASPAMLMKRIDISHAAPRAWVRTTSALALMAPSSRRTEVEQVAARFGRAPVALELGAQAGLAEVDRRRP